MSEANNRTGDDGSTWTDTEREVAAIWADVLGVERVTVDDDFSTLGGDSFLATVCLNRIRKTFNTRIKLSALMSEQVTLRVLAAELDGRGPANAS